MKKTQEFPTGEKTYLMMLKKLLFLISILTLGFVAVYGQGNSRESYIKKYKSIAIKEMERTGVPASIKLGQGILESNGGQSTLARKANNHFGMKCGTQWKGKTYFLEDDDYDANGRLIKSCFRVYKNAKDGFVAHSDFLRDPRKDYRYGFLFDLDPRDYKAWARGLKKAGYATSPTYADKLIGVIESYKLYQYDTMSDGKSEDEPSETLSEEQILAAKSRIKVNGIDVAIADGSKTIRDIALNQNVSVKCLLKYNENINQRTAVPVKDSRVFLKKKRSGYRGKDKKYHQVKAGDTMFDISQRYGVKLDKLLKRNRLEEGEQPAVGARIKLRGWFKVKDKPKTRDLSEEEEEDVFEEKPNDGFMDEETIDLEEEEIEDFDTVQEELFEDSEETKTETKPDPEPAIVYHTVVKGETLYGIARRYNTTTAHIKNLNKLAVNIISVGQRLRIK